MDSRRSIFFCACAGGACLSDFGHSLHRGVIRMKKFRFWGALVVLAALLLRPESAVAGAQRAMRLWFAGVAPALFPFLALMPALTGPEACAAYNALLSRVMEPLFHLPGAAAPALVIGMISGSPGGAIAVRRVAAQTHMGRRDAQKLALALSGVSPAFLILGVGQGMYGSAALGVRLALIQAALQLLLLVALRSHSGGEAMSPRGDVEEARPIAKAVETVLGVCGYMVIFGSVGSAAASLMGETAGGALMLVGDLPTGLSLLAGWDIPGKMLIQGAAIGFGGLCIAAQNVDAMRPLGVGWRQYLSVRGVAAACFAICCGVLLSGFAQGLEMYPAGSSRAFAFSMLVAGIVALPGLVYLSRSQFLNNRKRGA